MNTYDLDLYKISLTMQNNNIKIQSLDKILNITYFQTYDDHMITILFNMTINDFYEVCKTCFESLCVPNNKINISIIKDEQECIIAITYNVNFYYNFNIKLFNNLLIDQSEEIIKLENKLDTLKNFINNHLEITVGTYIKNNNEKPILLHIYTPYIEIRSWSFISIDSSNLKLELHGKQTFNSNLKLIMCKKICIVDLTNIIGTMKFITGATEINFNWNYLSDTIEEVKFMGYWKNNYTNINKKINGLIKRKFPNLHTLNFENCSDDILSNIYTNIIKPLNKTNKIQTVIIKNVKNFQELDKFKSFGIQCIFY
jgi:hypothetical protein